MVIMYAYTMSQAVATQRFDQCARNMMNDLKSCNYLKGIKIKMKKILELYRKHEEIVNYLIVGVCTTIVSLLSYLICTRTFLDVENPVQLQIANIIKWVSGVVFGYFTNRRFVFKSKNKNIGILFILTPS